MNIVISSPHAPAAVGPYSQAIQSGNLLFVSGQLPLDPQKGDLSGTAVKEQTKQVLENLQAVLDEAGFPLSSVVKCTCFLQDMNDFADFNEVYATYFTNRPPARECVEVAKLPKGALVEISAICAR